jgi:outer membrane immunogenic protein
MKTVVFAASFLAFGMVSAHAADFPATAPPPAPAAVALYSWTGVYAGVNAGAVSSDARTTMTASNFFASAALIGSDGSVGLDKTGLTAGGQAGYNWQMDRFLLGVEADIGYTDIKRITSSIRVAAPGLPLGFGVAQGVSSDWLATVRGRAGFVANEWLFYATGGAAIASFKFAQGEAFPDCPCSKTGGSSSTKVGWTIGGGVEFAAAFNWTVKAEYLYVDLGTQSFNDNLGAFGFPGASFTHQVRLTENIGRVGVNYHFNAPIAAKY